MNDCRCANCWDILETEEHRLCEPCRDAYVFCGVCERVWAKTDLAEDEQVDDFGCPDCKYIVPVGRVPEPGGGVPSDFRP